MSTSRLFLPAAQCFTLYILHFFYLFFLPVMGAQIASNSSPSQTMLWWKSWYAPVVDLCENFSGINLGAELPIIGMHNVYLTEYYKLLSRMTIAVALPPAMNKGSYIILHFHACHPWLYHYIWTCTSLSPLLDCKLLKGRVYIVHLCMVHYALIVLNVKSIYWTN